MADFGDWLGKTTGLWETKDSKRERMDFKSLRQKYEDNNNKLQRLADANTGVEGMRKAQKEALALQQNDAAKAGLAATQGARNAGMNSIAAAALGANTASDAFQKSDKQSEMYKAMGDQINTQQKIGENIKETANMQRDVYADQKGTDDETGNNARSLINAGISAATGGLGGGGLNALLGAAKNVIGNASASKTINTAANNMATGQGFNPQLAAQGLFQTPILPGIQANLGGI